MAHKLLRFLCNSVRPVRCSVTSVVRLEISGFAFRRVRDDQPSRRVRKDDEAKHSGRLSVGRAVAFVTVDNRRKFEIVLKARTALVVCVTITLSQDCAKRKRFRSVSNT